MQAGELLPGSSPEDRRVLRNLLWTITTTLEGQPHP